MKRYTISEKQTVLKIGIGLWILLGCFYIPGLAIADDVYDIQKGCIDKCSQKRTDQRWNESQYSECVQGCTLFIDILKNQPDQPELFGKSKYDKCIKEAEITRDACLKSCGAGLGCIACHESYVIMYLICQSKK
jgi:hypothetical protein